MGFRTLGTAPFGGDGFDAVGTSGFTVTEAVITSIGIAEEVNEALPLVSVTALNIAEEIDEALPLVVSSGVGPVFTSYYRRMGES